MSTDPLAAAREIMKQQAREAGQTVTERWHNHSSLDVCHPSRCPAGGVDWDGSGLVNDHFTSDADREGGCGDERGPPCGHAPTTIYDQVAMLRQLYAAGWGYHQIADLVKMSHEDMRGFLAAGVPTRQAEYLLERS